MNTDRSGEVAYGLYVFFSSVFSLAAIILVSWVLGVFTLGIIAAITGALLRIVSGGAHSCCMRNCVLMGAIVSPGIGLVSKFSVQSISDVLLYILIAIVGLYSIINIYKYAPADTPNKPITGQAARHRYRILSYVFMLVWFAVVGGLIIGKVHVIPREVFLASTLGLLWQVFSISPSGYAVVKRFDRIMS